MWELLLSPGSVGNSDHIKDSSWVMHSVRSHLFISAGGEYRIYSNSIMESTLMMLDVCHRQVWMTCHRISDPSSHASLLLPCVLFYQNCFNVETNKEICTASSLIFLISSFLKEMSWCFCTIVKTPNIKHVKEKLHCYNNSFLNLLPLCQSCDLGSFF